MNVLIYGFSGKILGGIETFILNMNEHMSPNCVFDYIIDGDTCVYKERIEKKGGEIFFVPEVKKNPINYIRKFRKILEGQKKRGTKILYIQLFSMANMLPVFLAKLVGYKVVLHAHNNGLQSKSKIYGIIHIIGKWFTKYGDYIRFTNSSLSSSFMFGEGVNSMLVYNAIDSNVFSFDKNTRDEVRREQSVDNKIVIGFVGRFSHPKNPLFMLNVFAEFSKLIENCELWIVGEGELKEEMLEEVSKLKLESYVKWLGRRNDVNRLMQGMDLLLQPSVFEGLGIVLVEAQATGLPVVSSADVVPQEAAVTSLIEFVSLNHSPFEWACKCVEQIKLSYNNNGREQASKEFPEYFKIENEACRLERLLRGIQE